MRAGPRGMLAAAVVTVAALGACSAGPSGPSGRGPRTAAGASTTASSVSTPTGDPDPRTTAPPPVPASTPRDVTLAFGGDVNFDGRVGALLTDDGLARLRPVLGAADLAMVNLETAITDRGTPQPSSTTSARRPRPSSPCSAPASTP